MEFKFGFSVIQYVVAILTSDLNETEDCMPEWFKHIHGNFSMGHSKKWMVILFWLKSGASITRRVISMMYFVILVLLLKIFKK